jgi:hypothetical protein
VNRIYSLVLLTAILAPLFLTTACAATPSHDLKMAPMNMLPDKNAERADARA